MAAPSLLSMVQPNRSDLKVLRLLLYEGASPDECDASGNTCLHLLAGSDDKDAEACLDVLLEYGAHCNVRTYDDAFTPLHIAASWGKDEVIRKLLAAGADITALSNDGETPYDLARCSVTRNLLLMCTSSVGLTVIAQPQTATASHDPRFFESTILYDLSTSIECPTEDDETLSSDTSPCNAAFQYNSDDSLLNPTDSDNTPRQPVPLRKTANKLPGGESPYGYDIDCTDQLQNLQLRSNEEAPSPRPGFVQRAFDPARTSYTSHGDCGGQIAQESSPIVSTRNVGEEINRQPCASSTSSDSARPALRSILKKPAPPADPVQQQSDRTMKAMAAKPSRSQDVQRDTTFRLSIGSPSIPSQSLLGGDADDVQYIEARKPWHAIGRENIAPSSTSTQAVVQQTGVSTDDDLSDVDCDTSVSVVIPREILALSNNELRKEAIVLGASPGPVMDSTRAVYQRFLAKEKARISQHEQDVAASKTPTKFAACYSAELYRCITGREQIPSLSKEEALLTPRSCLARNPSVATGYSNKAFFIYFLLDPTKTRNLPLRAVNDSLSPVECFQQFVDSIFYIGKGKRSRPFAHLQDAAKYCQNPHATGNQPKLERIRKIWQGGQGVVQFSCFQGTTSDESHTREACCIEAIGLKNLTNKVAGTSYGAYAAKPGVARRKMGAYLLYKACQIFLNEGERQYGSTVPVSKR